MLAELVDVGRRLEDNDHAASTKAAYARNSPTSPSGAHRGPASAFRRPETVYLYLLALVADDNAAGYAVSTLDSRLAAIGCVHEKSDYDNPCRHARRKVVISACSSLMQCRRTRRVANSSRYGSPQNAVRVAPCSVRAG